MSNQFGLVLSYCSLWVYWRSYFHKKCNLLGVLNSTFDWFSYIWNTDFRTLRPSTKSKIQIDHSKPRLIQRASGAKYVTFQFRGHCSSWSKFLMQNRWCTAIELRYHLFNQNIKVLNSEVWILFAKINNCARFI